jgi:hypothetical protein
MNYDEENADAQNLSSQEISEMGEPIPRGRPARPQRVPGDPGLPAAAAPRSPAGQTARTLSDGRTELRRGVAPRKGVKLHEQEAKSKRAPGNTWVNGYGRGRSKFACCAKRINERKQLFSLSSSEVRTLRELESEWQRLHREIHDHGYGSARRVIMKASEEVRKNPTRENIDRLKELNATGRDLQDQYQHVIGLLKKALQDFDENKVKPFVKGVLLRAAAALEKFAGSQETTERAFADLIGVPFEPSPALDAVLWRAAELKGIAENAPATVTPASPASQISIVYTLPAGD